MSQPLAAYQAGLVQLEALSVGRGRGLELVRLYSMLTEQLVVGLAGDVPPGSPGFSVFAAGGLARREQCPWSDIDLVIVHDGGSPEVLVQALIYPLWETRRRVGYRVLDVSEVGTGSRQEDLRWLTVMLGLRCLAGDPSLARRVLAQRADLISAWRPRFAAAALQENRRRIQGEGGSVYLLEPDLKEGRGGLRDLHWLGWLGQVLHGCHDEQALMLEGRLSPRAFRQLQDARVALLSARVALHRLEGRARDRLLFDLREPVARALGYKDTRKSRAADTFLREHYRHARRVAHHTGLFARRALGAYWDEPADSAPLPSVGLAGTKVTLAHAMGLLARVQAERGRLDHEAIEGLLEGLAGTGGRARSGPGVVASARRVLAGGHLGRTFLDLHLSGVLPRVFPEMARCENLAQQARVHRYTVDTHSIQAMSELEKLEGQVGPVQDAYRRLDPEGREVLALAVLLHDVGKAEKGRGHSGASADAAVAAGVRLGWGASALKRVHALVLHHLLMPRLAYRRDLADPATLQALLRVAETPEALDQLLLLTLADTAATNSTLLTPWKRALLLQLHAAGQRGLAGGGPRAEERAERVLAEASELLGSELPAAQAEQAMELVCQGLSGEEVAREGATELVVRARALLAHRQSGQPQVLHREMPHVGALQVILCGVDRPGLFAELCGCFSACRLSIIRATAVTRNDGVALDLFQVAAASGSSLPRAGQWDRIAAKLRSILSQESTAEALLRRAEVTLQPRRGAGLPEPSIQWVDDQTPEATVLDVTLPDRIGLLYEVARELHAHRLSVAKALIDTHEDRAQESFYVVNSRGQPVGRHSPVRRKLRRVLALL